MRTAAAAAAACGLAPKRECSSSSSVLAVSGARRAITSQFGRIRASGLRRGGLDNGEELLEHVFAFELGSERHGLLFGFLVPLLLLRNKERKRREEKEMGEEEQQQDNPNTNLKQKHSFSS
jgi:hypothetical protein